MTLRSVPARWFEMLVVRDDLTAAIDVLAQSSRVELQSHGETRAPLLLPECRTLLDDFDELERRYGRHWPAPRVPGPDERGEPHVLLQQAMQRLNAWVEDARDVVAQIEALSHQRADLELLLVILRDAESLPDLEMLVRAGPMLGSCLYRLPSATWPQSLPGSIITQRVVTPEHHFILAVGLPDDIEELERQLHVHKARPVHLPSRLPAAAVDAEAEVHQRLAATSKQLDAARREREALHNRHDIAGAIADVQFVRWYLDNVPELAATEHFAWITGWTSESNGQALLEQLADAGIKALLRVAEAPSGFEPPLVLSNPAWMRPFEVFTKLLGVPGTDEADPTRIVAVAAPLMFGFMFGDVGHGAVLLIAGLILSRHYPVLRLLIAGGAASIIFGFLFGSLFAFEDIIPPLWVNPLHEPVLMLLVPMAGGAVLLLIGMCLNALQSYWQQQGRYWWETGAGLVLCYLALLGSIVEPRLLWLALFGAVWFIIGHAFVAHGRHLAAAAAATVNFLESLLQLLVNTVSFVRVGAFALAHAGLSLAVVSLSEAPGSMSVSVLILVLGNVVIIGLEGLVVAVQTTRLLLFEFFIRFLHAEGRPFRPLSKPSSLSFTEHRSSR